MTLPLCCLLVEDSEDDARLVLHRLRMGGFDVSAERVDSPEATSAALDRQPWDIVISDFRMPGFSGLDALALVRARDRDLPFILLSGQMGEELAVEAMRAGASDYLTKDHLTRLVPAVQRELREAAGHRARAQAEAALLASEAQLRLVTDYAPVLIAHCDRDRRYRFVNRAYAEMFGQKPEELVGKHPREVLGDAVYAVTEPYMTAVLAGERVEYEIELPSATGERRTLHVNYAPERTPSGEVVGFVAGIVDISARVRAEEALLASNQQLKATLDASPDLFFETDLEGRYYDYHSPRLDLLAALPEVFLGKLLTEVLPAQAAATSLAALQEANEKQTSTGRQIQLDLPGGAKWFELSVARKETPAGTPPRFVTLSRDISARKSTEIADRFLAQAGIDPNGEPFFPALARFLATGLQMDFVCIDRLEGDQLNATTLAVWHDGVFEDNVSYALADTPCGEVAGQGVCCYPANVTAFFPRDTVLHELHAESYIGVPLLSHTGLAIGLIAVIGKRPLADRQLAEALLARVAPRAAAELERLSMETALRRSEARFRSMFAQAPLGVALIDSTSGAMLEVNARFATIVGRSIDELTRQSWVSIVSPANAEEGSRLLRQMASGGIPGFEMDRRHQRPDGSHVWLHLTIAPVSYSEQGEVRHLCMIEDIGERKLGEETLRRQNAVMSQFNAMAVGRELRMVELKREVNELCARLGEAPRHHVVATLPPSKAPE